MEDTFKPNHLLDYELDYELKIRGVVSQRNVSDKRKILSTLLNKENISKKSLIDNDVILKLDILLEKADIGKSLQSISDIISDFEGTAQDSTFLRMKSRLNHVSGRVHRLPTSDDDEEIVYKNESYATCLSLESDLYDKISKDSDQPSASMNSSFQQPIVTLPAPIINCSQNIPAIGDWQVKFNGDSKNLYNFLERISELAQSRRVKDEDLFNSAAELFIGDAFIWYKSIKLSVTSWQSLVDRLKKDFFHFDNEENLWEQIKQRKQKRNESVAVFIAHLQVLFSRLSNSPAEVTKVKNIRKNLLPEYITQLALLEINTVDDLAKYCRKLEEASYLKNKHHVNEINDINTFEQASCSNSSNNLQNKAKYRNFKSSKNNKSSQLSNTNKSTSDKNYIDENNYKPNRSDQSNKVHNLVRDNTRQQNTSSSNNIENIKDKIVCWNCDMPNHTFRNCKVKRKTFCYKCGLKNVKSSSCSRCSKNE